MRSKPSQAQEILGAILAGGASRRMGRDKALVELQGRSLLRRAITVLETVLDDVVVVAPPRQQYSDAGVPVVSDIRPGLGPVGGIFTALVQGAGRSVFVLACDMPMVTADLVRWIVDSQIDGGTVSPDKQQLARPLAKVVRDRHGAQPLCGLYSGDCLPRVEAALDEGRLSALDLLLHLETEYLELERGAVWYSPELLTNINDPEDLAAFAERSGRDS